MKIFMFAASLRKGSYNKKLIKLAANIVEDFGHVVDLANFTEFDMPLYNADIQDTQGFPETVTQFIARMQAAQAFIISTPEYNFSIPGTLKNLIDWVSRVTPMPWQQQRGLLLSASPSLVGGNRGLWATRIPLEACGTLIYPDMFSLSAAHEAFTDNDKFKNEAMQKRLHALIKDFLSLIEKLQLLATNEK